MVNCIRTNSDNADFQNLVHELDAHLAVINGEENAFFTRFNQLNSIQHVVLAYEDEMPVGCGAVKQYAEDTMEIKRMFVKPEYRGKGIASLVLNELEQWAKELNHTRCVLETDEQLKSAISLYKRSGYRVIPNYGQYQGISSSICFEKLLR